MRALTPAQRELVRPSVKDLPEELQKSFLAVANHQFRRLTRLVIYLRNAVMILPKYLPGIPRAEWHKMFLRSATSDFDRHLYKDAQYRFTPRGNVPTGSGNIFSTPFRLVNLIIDRGNYEAVLKKDAEFFGHNWSYDKQTAYVIDRFKRIRFHSP